MGGWPGLVQAILGGCRFRGPRSTGGDAQWKLPPCTAGGDAQAALWWKVGLLAVHPFIMTLSEAHHRCPCSAVPPSLTAPTKQFLVQDTHLLSCTPPPLACGWENVTYWTMGTVAGEPSKLGLFRVL